MYNILICDDEKTERELIIFLLEKDFHGMFSITEAGNGKEALDIIESRPIDILLSDIQMPLMSGIDLAKRAKEIFPDLEILFFSGYDDFEFVQNALVIHAVNYILKPINPDKFKSSMLEILNTLGSSSLHYTNSSRFIENNFHSRERAAITAPSSTSDSEKPNDEAGENLLEEELLGKIDNAIKLKKVDDIERLVSTLMNIYSDSKKRSHIYIRYVSSTLLNMIMSHLNSTTDEDFDQIATKIFTFKHYSDIKKLIRHYLDLLLEQYRQESMGSSYAVTAVKQYIDVHYSEDLSLNSLADMVFLNPNYLSTIFAKETSCSLNKYIKRVRMEKATELLLNSNKKIVDIARETGYSNTSYFIKAFQSIYGTTPEKYRNGNENEHTESTNQENK